MKRNSNFCILYCSKLLSFNKIEVFFYRIQITLLNFNLIKIFFASNKDSKSRRILFRKMSQKFNKIYCKSFKFARDLHFFKNKELILDLYVEKLRKMDKEELYNLMWSLVFCKFVTQKTKSSLRNFLPKNYQVTEDLEMFIL